MSESFSTTREADPCSECDSLPKLGFRLKKGVMRFELGCGCGANVYGYCEPGMDPYEHVDMLTKRWNELVDPH